MIHGPSLAIGAVISAAVLVIVFLSFDGMNSQPELVMQPTPTVEPQGPAKITMETFMENGSTVFGSPDAPITLVEFGDYQCHYCNVFFETTEEEIIKKYVETGKVKMIFKDYNIIGPDSVKASQGAHCAKEQNLFWEYHNILYSNWTGENNGWASGTNLANYAQDIGLEMNQWTDCMAQQKYSKTILTSNEDAKKLQLTGTPAFFVINSDGQVSKLFGAQPYDVFERVFDEQLEN